MKKYYRNIHLERISRYLLAVFVCGCLVASKASAGTADGPSPAGLWKTIDDKTGKAKSVIKIWIYKDVLYGKIVKLINPDEPNPVCTECKGKKHNKSVLGMKIMWGMKKSDDWWEGGKVLDPRSGKIYRCKLRNKNGNNTLEVRGYLGISLIGRSQTWRRVSSY